MYEFVFCCKQCHFNNNINNTEQGRRSWGGWGVGTARLCYQISKKLLKICQKVAPKFRKVAQKVAQSEKSCSKVALMFLYLQYKC